jgi:hypothetical protein
MDGLYRAINNSHDTHQIIARYHRKGTLVGFSKM